MASFRDRMNPEAIRFPGDLRLKILIVSGLVVDLCCAVGAYFIGGTIAGRVFDATVITLLAAFKLYNWPSELVVDQFGLHSVGSPARRNIHIPWREVGAVLPSVEVPRFGPVALGLRNDTVEFRSKDGKSAVVHTPHHPDRDRLLREPRLRGMTVDVSALT